MVPADKNHMAALDYMDSLEEGTLLVTSDYVYDELLTLLMVRGHKQRAIEWMDLCEQGAFEIEWATRADFSQATQLFRNYVDKSWSFTDCVSFTMIDHLDIKEAFAFDDHFRQSGKFRVVPDVT